MGKKEKPLREIIYNHLLEDIIHGIVSPGVKLLESELAEKFNVSRTPIREVLLQLENEGYILHTKNVGAVVKKISARTVQETYELVAFLEGYATELAIEKIKDEDVSFLKNLQKSLMNSLKEKKFSVYVQQNAAFHGFFVKKCGNETLQQVISDLRKRIYRLMVEGQTVSMHIEEYLTSHNKIIEAIAKRNRSKAGDLMKSHILDASRFLLDMIANLPRQQF